MGERRRARADEYAERVNAAAVLLRSLPSEQATRRLAAERALSPRQARRYVRLAARAPEGVLVPERTGPITLKLPLSVIARLRACARRRGLSASGVAAEALRRHLDRLEGPAPDGPAG